MNSEELKGKLIQVLDELGDIKNVVRRLDTALEILHGENTPDTYKNLMSKLDKADRTLWDIRFSDLTGLDKLLWPQSIIDEAKEWYDTDPYIERTESDDSYSTWSWKASWDDLRVLEQDKVIQQYMHNQREEHATA